MFANAHQRSREPLRRVSPRLPAWVEHRSAIAARLDFQEWLVLRRGYAALAEAQRRAKAPENLQFRPLPSGIRGSRAISCRHHPFTDPQVELPTSHDVPPWGRGADAPRRPQRDQPNPAPEYRHRDGFGAAASRGASSNLCAYGQPYVGARDTQNRGAIPGPWAAGSGGQPPAGPCAPLHELPPTSATRRGA